MNLNWTTIAASGITASIICSFQFFTTRYLGRILDHIEKRIIPIGKAEDIKK